MQSLSSELANSTSASAARGRGRGKSRGGLGKYLRARGRGRGGGRPAEFHKRLLLEDEELDSEEAEELTRKYTKRQLGSNADRYAEPGPVLNSDGEVEEEPEIDLSSFLARQVLSDSGASSTPLRDEGDEDDVDKSLAHLASKSSAASQRHKGNVQTIEWDEELEQIRKEKEVADANRDLKTRFRANAERQKSRQARTGPSVQVKERSKCREMLTEAPPLPTEEAPPPKGEKGEMEDFLDDLLG